MVVGDRLEVTLLAVYSTLTLQSILQICGTLNLQMVYTRRASTSALFFILQGQ